MGASPPSVDTAAYTERMDFLGGWPADPVTWSRELLQITTAYSLCILPSPVRVSSPVRSLVRCCPWQIRGIGSVVCIRVCLYGGMLACLPAPSLGVRLGLLGQEVCLNGACVWADIISSRRSNSGGLTGRNTGATFLSFSPTPARPVAKSCATPVISMYVR